MKNTNLNTTGFLALILLVPTLRAQSGGGYDLSWFTIDGGGGTSTGGAYAVSGTIGQPAASKLTGGNYTLVGGFWSLIQNGGSPWLSIRRSGNSVVLSWPDPSTGFQLQQTTGLNGPATVWTDVSQTPAVANGNKELSLLITPDNRCFRLRKP